MLTHQVIQTDCIKYLTENPFCPQVFDCIFADPPFNIGRKYNGYDDNKTEEAYFEFTDRWILACWNRLKPGGAMIVHGSPTVANTMFVSMFANSISRFIETELIWSYNFGQCRFDNFIQTHCRAMVVRKPDGPRSFHVEEVLTKSKRLLMGDKRVAESRYKGYIPFGTVWGLDSVDGIITEPVEAVPHWGRVQGNNRERRHGHDNQLPEKYVERILKAYSKEGDLVFDPFAGSGTTVTVSKHLDRSCITTDVSEWSCNSIRQRLNEGAKIQ